MNNDSDEKRRFSQNVKDTLAKKERRGCTFNAGNPHPVFIQKGMPDKPIRISPAVIRKARKHTKYNNHCVKQADMERLPDLLRNPAALLKSISKPNTFIVVLDAKDEKNLPVIAAIKSENDINEITSVYGRDNFENFIVRTNEAGAVLSVNKNKINEGVWAYQQYQGETTFDDFNETAYTRNKNLSSDKKFYKENNTEQKQNWTMTAEERKEKEQELRGYVDGICECANIVKQKDLPLAGSMLKDLRITKELAQKYAKPETFNEMKKDIYAPKIEQKLERNNTRGRGM